MRCLLATSLTIGLAMGFSAGTATAGLWDSEGATNLWSEDANWEADTQPIDADGVITYHLSNGGTTNPVIDATVNAQAGTVLLGDLGSFDWGGGPVELNMSGGTLTVFRSSPGVLGDFKMGRVDFLNWLVNDPPGYTSVGTNEAIFNLSGGNVDLEGAMFVGEGSSATVNQTGGDISTNAVLINANDSGVADAFAQYNLDGGTLHVRNENDFHMWQNTNFDLGGGVLTIVGNRSDVLSALISDGRMTAFDGTGIVNVSYDANANLTTVVGAIPEPATTGMLLIALGAAAVRRR